MIERRRRFKLPPFVLVVCPEENGIMEDSALGIPHWSRPRFGKGRVPVRNDKGRTKHKSAKEALLCFVD
jgi:hypothetical protein